MYNIHSAANLINNYLFTLLNKERKCTFVKIHPQKVEFFDIFEIKL